MRSAVSLLVVLVIARPGWGQDTPRPEQLLRFDPQRLDVTWAHAGWGLGIGGQPFKDFGRRQADAYEAQRLIRELNLTERGVIGDPTPVLEYWLSSGAAPTGNGRHQRVIAFDLASLRVEGEGGQFCLRDAQRVLFNFGYAKEEADQALAVFRKYHFSRVIALGQATPSMMVFLRDPAEAFAPTSHDHKPPILRAAPIKTNPRPGEDKKQGLAAIQSYVTPVIPALGAGPAANTALPSAKVAGITDRIRRVPFDWRQANLRRGPSGWLLQAGSLVLGSFGSDEMLARKALLAAQYYRFNELCLVGGDPPCAHFYTVNGLAPHGDLFGVPTVRLIPERLSIQEQNGHYALAQGTEVVLALGDRPEDARQLLDWIQRQRVERLARLMTPDGQGMMFFLKR